MKQNRWQIRCVLAFVLLLAGYVSFGQGPTDSLPPDPGSITISTVQNMKFGAFYLGNTGGTIKVATNGSRSVTGSVVLLSLGIMYCQAIFDLEAPEGTIISIWNGPDATLSGSNGGSVSLHIDASSPVSPFNSTVAPPGRTSVNIGGTITVPAGAPTPGTYSGSFYITFNNE